MQSTLMQTRTSMPDAEPLLIDISATAKTLAVSERTVWGLAKDKSLKSVRIGRRLLFDRRDLFEFVDKAKS
jgi:excisionase family DNA binding protein